MPRKKGYWQKRKAAAKAAVSEPKEFAKSSTTTAPSPESKNLSQVVGQLAHLSLEASPTQPGVFGNRVATNQFIMEIIFDCCSAVSMARLGKTCRATCEALRTYTLYAFSINRSLRRFFKDPLTFRSHQARTNTLISGSFALQFFDRGFYEGSDLDLYCTYQRGDHGLGLWLLEEGYSFVPCGKQRGTFVDVLENTDSNDDERAGDAAEDARPSSPMHGWPYEAENRGIKTVCTFTRRDTRAHEDVQVQIIFTYESPMEVIMGFHSTTVMNVIAFDCAYAMYPLATYEARLFLHLGEGRHQDPRIPRILEKYRRRGFAMVHERPAKYLVALPHRARLFPDKSRCMGDQYTWRIPLSMEGVTPPPAYNEHSRPLSADPCFCTFWRLRFAVIDERESRYIYEERIIDLCPRLSYFATDADNDFRHTYVIADGPVGEEVGKEMRKCAAQVRSEGPRQRDAFMDEEFIQACKNMKRGTWLRWSSLQREREPFTGIKVRWSAQYLRGYAAQI